MVKEYLEHCRNTLIEEKISCENRHKKLEQRLKENKEFRSLLEKKTDPNFEAFTPHIVHSKDKEKISELEAEEKQIIEEKNSLEDRIKNLDNQLIEISDVIFSASENEETIENLKQQIEQKSLDGIYVMSIEEKERKYFDNVMQDKVLSKIDDIIYKLELCSKLEEVDIGRCKLEINSLYEIAKTVKNEICLLTQNVHFPQIDNSSDLSILIQNELESIKSVYNINTFFQIEGDQYDLHLIIKKVILYIVKVWLNSIKKIEGVNEVSICLKYDTHLFYIEITDNRNVDNEKIKDEDSVLLIINRYITLLSGKVQIEQTDDKDTMISICVPINIE